MARYCEVAPEKAPFNPSRRAVAASVAVVLALGVVMGYLLAQRPPAALTAPEAARILAERQGWAGFTEVEEGGGKGTIRHAVFCQNCGIEVGAVRVDFHEQAMPEVGSRSAIWRGLADSSMPKVANASDMKALSK